MAENNLYRLRKWNYIVLLVLATGVILYFASAILFTILFAGMLCLALTPISNRLEKVGFRRWLASLLLVLGLAVIIVGIFTVFALRVQNFNAEIPEFSGDVSVKMEMIQSKIEQHTGINQVSSYMETDTLTKKLTSKTDNLLSIIFSIGSFMITVPVYLYFMLVYRDNFTAFLRLGAKNTQEIQSREKLLSNIKGTIKNYIKGMGLVITIVSTLSTVSFILLDIPYAFTLGITAGILTLIPYFGVFIGAVLPLLMAFFTKDSLFYPLGVLLSVVIIQFLEGNLITPKIMGDQLHLNPLAVIISLIVFGYLGGILGMMLAVPLIAISKILLEHYPDTRQYALLFGNGVQLKNDRNLD